MAKRIAVSPMQSASRVTRLGSKVRSGRRPRGFGVSARVTWGAPGEAIGSSSSSTMTDLFGAEGGAGGAVGAGDHGLAGHAALAFRDEGRDAVR